jgi:hypothetical protein
MKIVSKTDLYVATTWGACIRMKMGEPIEVSEALGTLAIQAGAEVYNPNNVEHELPEEAVFEEVVEEEESSVDPEVVEALQKLIEEADPNSFKGDGNPKAAVLNKMLGRTVRADEREAAWEIALNS